MSCIGESDRNVENLFADAFDIRYIVSLQSTVFNAIYTSEDHVPGIRYIVTRSACKRNWPIKNSKKTVLMRFPRQRIRRRSSEHQWSLRRRLSGVACWSNWLWGTFGTYKNISFLLLTILQVSVQLAQNERYWILWCDAEYTAMMMCGKTNICFLNLGCIFPRDVQS